MIPYFLYLAIIFLSIIIGLLNFKSLIKCSKIMLLLLIFTLIEETVIMVYREFGFNSVYIYHIFMPIEFVMITASFYLELKYNFMKFISIFFISFSIINSLFIQSYTNTFCSYTFVLQCIITTIWVLLFLKKLLNIKVVVSFKEYPLFWFGVGFLIFNIINLFILGTHNTLAAKVPNINKVFRNIRFLSNYLLYTSFIFAFLSKQASLESIKNE